MKIWEKRLGAGIAVLSLILSVGMPVARTDELSDLQNARNVVLADMKTVETKVAGLLKAVADLASSYDACIASTKVESSTVSIDSCNAWLEKQSVIKSDITSLTTLLASIKAKISAIDNAISKYQASPTPTPPSFSFNDMSKFDSAVTSYFSKYVGDVRAAYKANGIPEEFTNSVPSPPGFSNTSDGTNDAAINDLANRLVKWWELEHAALKTKIAARQNNGGDNGQTFYYNDVNKFNDVVRAMYAKYVDDIKYQIKISGTPDVAIETVPSSPTFSTRTDGTNDAAVNAYVSAFQSWHAKALAQIKLASGSGSNSPSRSNQFDDRAVFEEQVNHYYEKYVYAARDWMERLGITGGFHVNPPNKPMWTNTSDGTNDRLVNAFTSQMSVWWSAQNDRLQPLQDKYDAENKVYQFNDLNSFTSYKNSITQKFISGVVSQYKSAGIEYPESRNSGLPGPPNFLDGRVDGTNEANLQTFVNALSSWYMAEMGVLNSIKAKLGIKTPVEQDQSQTACNSIYEKIKGTYINIDVQVANLELMVSNPENFALKSKALGLTNVEILQSYWFGQLSNLKNSIAGGYAFSSDKQNFQTICANHPQFDLLNSSVIGLTNRYEELTARYNAISIGMKKAIDIFVSNYLGNDALKGSVSERNQSCINVYNSVANEINSRMLDLTQIQDLFNQRMTIQTWLSKYPAGSWPEVQSTLMSILSGVSSFGINTKQNIVAGGKIYVLCTGTESGPSVLAKLITLTENLTKYEISTTQTVKDDFYLFATKPWIIAEDNLLREKLCNEFVSSFAPSISSLSMELNRLKGLAGNLSGTATQDNANFVSNTQQLLIQLKNLAWALYDKMKRSSANVNGCADNDKLFQAAVSIAESTESEYNALSEKWRVMQSGKKETPVECSNFMAFYHQKAAGYMDLYRMYADIWRSQTQIVDYIRSNNVQSWQAAFEIFLNKTNSVTNLVNLDRSEINNSEIKLACAGVKDGDQLIAKTVSIFAEPGPLTYMRDMTYSTIKSGFNNFSNISLATVSQGATTQEQMCNAMESYYSQLSNSLIQSLQNISGQWSSVENLLLIQKNKAISVPVQFDQIQNLLSQILDSMNAASSDLRAGKLLGSCKGLSFSGDYEKKIDSLFNLSNGTVRYWFDDTSRIVQSTYLAYKKSLQLPVNERDATCKAFSVDSLKTIATLRSYVAAIREKFRFTVSAIELSDSTKNLSFQNMGSALLDIQNSLLETQSSILEFQKSSKCTQLPELLKQLNATSVDLKGVQSEMQNVGWKVGSGEEHAISTVSNADKTIGGDSLTAQLPAVVERPTIVDQVKATLTSSKTTNIQVVTNYPGTKLTIVAKKTNSNRKISYSLTTTKTGGATLKTGTNLKGYQVTIYVGSIPISKSNV